VVFVSNQQAQLKDRQPLRYIETQDWEQTAAIIGRFFEAKAEDLS
jgi:hypothetical protein